MPLLLELLRHQQVSFQRFAADAFIDLVPDTEAIQPALRRALRDEIRWSRPMPRVRWVLERKGGSVDKNDYAL